jgi:hypothetical protein
MKRTFQFFMAAAAMAFSASLFAQMSGPEIAFDSADILKMPDGMYLGEVGGVATNSKGHIFVYTRTGHPYATVGDSRTFYHGGSRLFEFDQTGKYVREVGQGLYGFNAAQNLRIDAQDNIWAVDAGSSQVMKFDADGRAVQLVFGRKPENISVAPRGGGPGGGGAALGPGGGGPPGGRGAGGGGAAPAGGGGRGAGGDAAAAGGPGGGAAAAAGGR